MVRILKGFSILLLGLALIITSSAATYAGQDKEVGKDRVQSAQAPGLSLKLQGEDIPYKPGESIDYEIKVRNTGDIDLKGLQLDDLLLDKKTTIDSLGIGEELIFKEAYEIPLNIKDGSIVNKVSVAGEGEGIKVEASDSFKSYIEKIPSIEDVPGETDSEDAAKEDKPPDKENDLTEAEREKPKEKEKTKKAELEIGQEQPIEEIQEAVQEETDKPSEDSIGPMVAELGGIAQLQYDSDTDVLPLWMKSTNQHTKAISAWMYEGDIYLAIISQGIVKSVTYNGEDIKNYEAERAVGARDQLVIYVGSNKQEINKGDIDNYGYEVDKGDHKHRWSVIKIPDKALTTLFTIGVTMDVGGGHWLQDAEIYIYNYLQVYHKYDGSPPIFDIEQSGSLKDGFDYKVEPKYERDGVTYHLVNIERDHNGEVELLGPEALEDGALLGAVTPKVINNETIANGIITFIYKKADNGELTITKKLQNSGLKDKVRKFDILISGPGGSKYMLSLKPGESKTITGLKYGTYTIKEIVPMNFEVANISASSVTLSKENKKGSSTIINKRINNGWFYNENTKENRFTIGTSSG